MSKMKRKMRFVLTAVTLIMALSVAVFAYLSTVTDPLTNTFSPDKENDPNILEGTTPGSGGILVKENVRVDVGNPGYAVYVRAAIVVTWEKTEGGVTKVHARKPVEGADYALTLGASGWFAPVTYDGKNAATAQTKVLISSCHQTAEPPETGYQLHVRIVAQTVQALGSTDVGDIPAVTNAWGVAVNKTTKKLTDPTP